MTLDTLSAAIAEAYASAADHVRFFDTLELYHDDWAYTLRAVNDTADFNGVLEASAPRDASTEQTFTAFAFRAQLPDRGEEGRQELQIQIDNVSLEVFDLLQSHSAANGAVEIIFRVFVNSDPSGPGQVFSMTVKSVAVSKSTVTLGCLYSDDVNRKFPSLTYQQAQWPGLFK